MTLAEGQGSSCCKGKGVVSGAPTVWDIGKEAFYSKSDHSDEEEAQHDPDNECASLLDTWYDTHAHLPKVPCD